MVKGFKIFLVGILLLGAAACTEAEKAQLRQIKAKQKVVVNNPVLVKKESAERIKLKAEIYDLLIKQGRLDAGIKIINKQVAQKAALLKRIK